MVLIGFFTKTTTPTAWDASYLIMISVEFLGAEEEIFDKLGLSEAKDLKDQVDTKSFLEMYSSLILFNFGSFRRLEWGN